MTRLLARRRALFRQHLGWRLLLALVILLTSATLPGPGANVVLAKSGTLTKNTALYDAPANKAAIMLTLRRGAALTIDGKAKAGYYPASYGNLEGWVETGSIATKVDGGGKKKQAAVADRVEAETDLDLRATPSDSAPVLRLVPKGAAVVPTGNYRDGYVEIEQDGSTGWAHGESLTVRVTSEEGSRNPREMSQAEIIQVIYDAADYYRQPRQDMLRVARCESDLVPRAINREGKSYGIFQFKTGTWLSTPYADYDIFDPRASAYAAGWMWSVGRRNEWVCQ